MPPRLRRLALTAHIAASVGWLGAVVVVLALGVAVVSSRDDALVGAAYRVMDWTGWSVLVPLALASLVTGLVQSLGTTWGLLRHWWVVAKLVLTLLATGVLLLYTGTLAQLGAMATEGRSPVLRNPSPLVHTVGALVVLVAALALSVFKPAGLTARGWRARQRAATSR